MHIERFLQDERLPASYARVIEDVHEPLARTIHRKVRDRGHYVVGLCGCQGSGKSTMARSLRLLLEAHGVSCAVLSLDDFYLERSAREVLGKRVHPLLVTRGVPGTHDVQLAIDTLEALGRPQTIALPAFDKSRDDRKPVDEWPRVQGPVQVVLFEGWCVGAIPQDDADLAQPVNALEREQDADGRWRRYVNDALRAEYRTLFRSLDALLLLQAPSYDVVYDWRREQEHKLGERIAAAGQTTHVMSDHELARFIQHYERLTRHILSEMPARADAIVKLSETREPLEVMVRRGLEPTTPTLR